MKNFLIVFFTFFSLLLVNTHDLPAQSSWTPWYSTGYNGIQYALKRGSEYNGKYEWFIKWRNTSSRDAKVSYDLVDKSSTILMEGLKIPANSERKGSFHWLETGITNGVTVKFRIEWK